MMEPSLALVLDKIENMPLEVTDEDLQEKDNDIQTRQTLAFNRDLHYLLALIADDSAKLIVRQNTADLATSL